MELDARYIVKLYALNAKGEHQTLEFAEHFDDTVNGSISATLLWTALSQQHPDMDCTLEDVYMQSEIRKIQQLEYVSGIAWEYGDGPQFKPNEYLIHHYGCGRYAHLPAGA